MTLEQKIKVLKEIQKKTLYRIMAEKFNIAKGTVTNIQASKYDIEAEAHNASNLQLKRPRRAKTYEDANSCVLEFFGRCRAINVPVDGSMLRK